MRRFFVLRLGILGILGILGVLGMLGVLGKDVLAQKQEAVLQDELESCFVYYDYGKVRVNLATEKPSYSVGETVKIHGTIVNENSFPLAGVILYAHVRRVNSNSQSFINNGHYLIDRLTLSEGLNFLPEETKWVERQLPILPTYPNGEYQLQYFIFSQEGFHYAGRPFVEEDTAGYSGFRVVGGQEAEVYFDVDSLKVGEEVQTVRGPIVEFPQRPLAISVGVRGLENLGSLGNLGAKIGFYKFEDTFEEDKVLERNVQLIEGRLETVFLPPGPGAYVFLAEIDEPVRTMFKYRLAIADSTSLGRLTPGVEDSKRLALSPPLRMNDVGVTDFPATNNSRAWICFHSPTNKNAPNTKVVLSVLDSGKNVVADKTVEGEFGPEVVAISVPLKSLGDFRDFWVRGEIGPAPLQNHAGFGAVRGVQGSEIRVVEKHYDCSVFGESQADFKVEYRPRSASGQYHVGYTPLGAGFVNQPRTTQGAGFGDKGNLVIRGIGGCGEELGRGGYIESVRIKEKESGVVKKELYNLDSPDKLAVADLPAGTYTAEIKGPAGREEVEFTVASLTKHKEQKIVPMALVLIALIAGGAIYLRLRYRHKQDE